MDWPRSRLYWTVLTFAPSALALVVALSSALSGQWHDALLWLLWSATSVAMGNATLSSYRAGYWRGRVEEAQDSAETHTRKLLSGWQPAPWDDDRW